MADSSFPSCLQRSDPHLAHHSLPLVTSLNTSGSSFIGTLQEHLEKKCSQAGFDVDLAMDSKGGEALVNGTNPFP